MQQNMSNYMLASGQQDKVVFRVITTHALGNDVMCLIIFTLPFSPPFRAGFFNQAFVYPPIIQFKYQSSGRRLPAP